MRPFGPEFVAGVIVAGGESRRMGTDKRHAPLAGRPLIQWVVERVQPQVSVLALNRRDTARGTASVEPGLPCMGDAVPEPIGPLGGVLAGADWARGLGKPWLATFPCDTPFLPRDLVAALGASAMPNRPVVAVHGGAVQSLCALWPVSAAEALREGILDKSWRSVRRALNELDAVCCAVEAPDHAFLNVNTPADFAAARRIAQQTH